MKSYRNKYNDPAYATNEDRTYPDLRIKVLDLAADFFRCGYESEEIIDLFSSIIRHFSENMAAAEREKEFRLRMEAKGLKVSSNPADRTFCIPILNFNDPDS